MHKNLDSLSIVTQSVQSSYHLVSTIYPHWPSDSKSLHDCSADIPFISSSGKAVIVQVTVFLTADQLSYKKKNANFKYIEFDTMIGYEKCCRLLLHPETFFLFTYSNKHNFKAIIFASVYIQLYLFLHFFLNQDA